MSQLDQLPAGAIVRARLWDVIGAGLAAPMVLWGFLGWFGTAGDSGGGMPGFYSGTGAAGIGLVLAAAALTVSLLLAGRPHEKASPPAGVFLAAAAAVIILGGMVAKPDSATIQAGSVAGLLTALTQAVVLVRGWLQGSQKSVKAANVRALNERQANADLFAATGQPRGYGAPTGYPFPSNGYPAGPAGYSPVPTGYAGGRVIPPVRAVIRPAAVIPPVPAVERPAGRRPPATHRGRPAVIHRRCPAIRRCRRRRTQVADRPDRHRVSPAVIHPARPAATHRVRHPARPAATHRRRRRMAPAGRPADNRGPPPAHGVDRGLVAEFSLDACCETSAVISSARRAWSRMREAFASLGRCPCKTTFPPAG